MARGVLLALLLGACSRAPAPAAGFDWPFFHGDRARTGWNAMERALTPATVASSRFGHRWDSDAFDDATVDGVTFPPRAFASPLYDDASRSILVATTNGWVYALDPRDGATHWKLQVAEPYALSALDGKTVLGILSTPALDVAARRLYTVAQDAASQSFVVAAVDVDRGAMVTGFPLVLDAATVMNANTNGPAMFLDPTLLDQRGALNLSPDGNTLYIPFGTHTDAGSGWMVSVDLPTRTVSGSFAVTPNAQKLSGAGIWGAGGPVVDDDGTVFDTTGNADESFTSTPHVWGETLLALGPGMQLAGTYTPWNFCQLEKSDTDLGGSSPTRLPDFDPSSTATPHLLAFGSKQGNVYLIDRDHLSGSTTSRQPCSTDPTSDGSLLPPDPQPALGARGPLNVFGPYSEIFGNTDRAKMRSVLAYFHDAAGTPYLFASGASKATADSTTSVPPSLARLKVVLAPEAPAYLAIDATEPTLAFVNPGSPIVTSNGSDDAIVWVLDGNASRSASVLDSSTPHPILYAVDATTMQLLWKTSDGELALSGKYNTPLVVNGVVYVATDRLQAYGLR